MAMYMWNFHTLVITEKLFYFPLKIPYAKIEAQPIE